MVGLDIAWKNMIMRVMSVLVYNSYIQLLYNRLCNYGVSQHVSLSDHV